MKETKETKPISFRLPAKVFNALLDKGEGMELSAHEVASKIVQENYQVQLPVQNEDVTDNKIVTCSKQIFLPPPSKQVFHFTLNDLKSISFALSGRYYLPPYIFTLPIGKEYRGIKPIGENLWEVEVQTSDEYCQ